MAIGTLAVNVVANTGKAVRNLASFRGATRGIAADVTRAGKFVAGFGVALAGVGAGIAIAGIRKSMETLDELAKTADRLGIATEKLAGLRLAAEEAGAGAAGLDKGLEQMVRRISEAAAGSGQAGDALAELGLSAQMMNQLTPDEQFRRIAEGMKNVTNQADKVRIAYDLFGRSGVTLINTLSLGAAGLDEAQAAAEKLGLALNRVDVAQVEAANDAIGRVKASFTGAFNILSVKFAPAITALSERFVEWATEGNNFGAAMQNVFKGVAGAIGIVGDTVHWLKLGFMKMQSWTISAIATIVGALADVEDGMMALVNILPGIELESNRFLRSYTEELEKTAAKAEKAFDAAYSMKKPSEQIKDFFAQVETDAAAARNKMAAEAAAAAAAKAPNRSFGTASVMAWASTNVFYANNAKPIAEAGKKLGELLGGNLAEKAGKALGGLTNKLPAVVDKAKEIGIKAGGLLGFGGGGIFQNLATGAALERGTVAAYSAARQGATDSQLQILAVNRLQLTALSAIAENTRAAAGESQTVSILGG